MQPVLLGRLDPSQLAGGAPSVGSLLPQGPNWVKGLVFRVQGLGFRVRAGPPKGFKKWNPLRILQFPQCIGFRDQGFEIGFRKTKVRELRVEGLGFSILGLWIPDWDLGLRV